MKGAPSKWSDVEILTVLDLMDNQLLSATSVAKIMTARRGSLVSRNAILGIRHRVEQACDDSDPTDVAQRTRGARSTP